MFSELVDSVVARTGRPDQLAAIVDYVNSTVRECQTKALFYKDLVEDVAVASSDPLIWTYPRTFRTLRAVRYGDGTYPDLLLPGKIQYNQTFYYYAASTYFVFCGAGTDNSNIALAYYAYRTRLKYYAVGARPAVYDETNDTWSYLNNITDPVLQEVAQQQVTNWLINFHHDLITEGACAKVFKSVGDQRSVMSFSLYKSMQEGLVTLEANEALNTGVQNN